MQMSIPWGHFLQADGRCDSYESVMGEDIYANVWQLQETLCFTTALQHWYYAYVTLYCKPN